MRGQFVGRLAIGVALIGTTAFVTEAVSVGATSTPVTYYACLKGGTLSRVSIAAHGCSKGYKAISWGAVGPQGARGPQGPGATSYLYTATWPTPLAAQKIAPGPGIYEIHVATDAQAGYPTCSLSVTSGALIAATIGTQSGPTVSSSGTNTAAAGAIVKLSAGQEVSFVCNMQSAPPPYETTYDMLATVVPTTAGN